MKKASIFFIALVLVAFSVSAQEAETTKKLPAPEVTYGVSAEAEVNLVSEKTTAEKKVSGDVNLEEAKLNPNGLKVTKFVSNDWANFDWSKASIKAEAKYDAYRATADDFSFLKVTSTWKDLFGFQIKHEYALDSKEIAKKPAEGNSDPNTPIDRTPKMDKVTNDVTITYDKLETDGIKFWTKYNANQIYAIGSVTDFGPEIGKVFTDFKEMGFEFNNDEINSKLVLKTGTAGKVEVDTATFKAKDMFGMWTSELNNSDEVKLRLKNLDSDSKIDREEFVIGKDNKIQSKDGGKDKMNVLNTIKLSDSLTFKALAIAPSKTEEARKWLKEGNLSMSAEFAMEDIGTLAAGARIMQDYVTSTGTLSGPSALVVDGKSVNFGNAFWADAKLDKMLGEDKAVFVGVDAQFGNYDKTFKTNDGAEAGKVKKTVVGSLTKVSLYGETKMKFSDALSMSAGVLAKLGLGYDYKAVTNSTFSDKYKTLKDDKGSYVAGNFNESNDLNSSVYDIVPFELKARADLKLNDKATLFVSDNFKMNEGALHQIDKDNPTNSLKDGLDGGRDMFGFYQKNTVGLGAILVSTPKSKLTVSTDINLFLGVPAASKLYTDGATDAQKKEFDVDYAVWKSANFNPFTVKVAYKYEY